MIGGRKGSPVSAVLDKHRGEEGSATQRYKREKKANSHIWHHHGGSLENQLSGKYNCTADSMAEENCVMYMVMAIMG